MRQLAPLLAALLVAAPAAADQHGDALARAESAWERRAEGHQEARAAAEAADRAIEAFQAALAEEPEDLAIRSRLLEALWFKGEHVPMDPASRVAVFEEARNIAQQTIDGLLADLPDGGRRATTEQIAAHLRETDNAAEIFYWGAAHWALWGRYRGKIASARQGVAGKVRDCAQVVIALDEEAKEAGGRRILGRLHTEAPKLPFVTGWIDRDEAVRQLEHAVELAPDYLFNRFYYLEALIRFDKARRAQAVRDLRAFVETEPRPAAVVEDMKVLSDARELLRRVDR